MINSNNELIADILARIAYEYLENINPKLPLLFAL